MTTKNEQMDLIPQTLEQLDYARVVSLWLHGRPPTTREAYLEDVRKFFSYAKKLRMTI